MYVNKCIKCGREFETKNPKRVICPDCLYPDKKMMVNSPETPEDGTTVATPPTEQLSNYSTEDKPQFYSSYSSGGDENPRPYNRHALSQSPVIPEIIVKVLIIIIIETLVKVLTMLIAPVTEIIVKPLIVLIVLITEIIAKVLIIITRLEVFSNADHKVKIINLDVRLLTK